MIAAGISTRPFGTIPVSAIVHEESAAAKPSKNPGTKVSRNPLRPRVRIASTATRRNARRLWAKIASAVSNAPPSPAARTRLDSTGRTTDGGTALVEPARKPARAPMGKPAAAISIGIRRIQRRRRNPGR